jgi:hypothetical protein
MRKRIVTKSGIILAVIVGGCLFGGVDELPCWLDRNEDKGDCYYDYLQCAELDNTEAGVEACYGEYEECLREVDADTLECTGDDSCFKPYKNCHWNCWDSCENSDDEDCFDDCWDDCADDFEDCAPWYDRACQEECTDDMDDCINIAIENYTTDAQMFDDAKDCAEELFEDCIPDCYEE